jgi:hypothetical protein
LTKKSGSKGSARAGDDFESAVERLRREAAPVIAKALDLDRAEAAEAALNAATEFALAARELLRALPLPPEARTHVDRAEREAVRAAKLLLASMDKGARRGRGDAPLKEVRVAFKTRTGGKRKTTKGKGPPSKRRRPKGKR